VATNLLAATSQRRYVIKRSREPALSLSKGTLCSSHEKAASSYTAPMQKTLLITGAGRGIGAATAILAAKRGYTVHLNYRQNSQAANAVITQIQSAGGKATAIQADVSQESEVIRLFETVDKFGHLTALVNNAGYTEKQSRVEAMDAPRLQRVFAT